MKAHSLLLAPAVLTAAAALSQLSSPLSTANQLVTLLAANGLKADVSFLALDLLEAGDTPSRGLDIAAEYIAAQFRRAGLEAPVDGGYFQNADFFQLTRPPGGVTL